MSRGSVALQVLGHDGGPARIDVVARIDALDPEVPSSELVVTQGGMDVSLDAGAYAVQIFLPSGRVLQQGLKIEAGTRASLVFREPMDEDAGFSLQEASGATTVRDLFSAAVRGGREPVVPIRQTAASAGTSRPARAGANKRSGGRAPGTSGVRSRPTLIRMRGGLGRQRQDGERVGSGQKTRDRVRSDRLAGVVPAVTSLPSPKLMLAPVGSFEGIESWDLVAKGSATQVRRGDGWQAATPDEQGSGAAIWRLAPTVAGSFAGGSRRWAVVSSTRGVELVSLPAPWNQAGGGGLSPIDLFVDTRVGGRASSSVAIHDDLLSGLLLYLDRGRISALRPMVAALEKSGVIEQTIHDKMANPLAACAAAYVGLAVLDPADDERWDAWLPNIMERFAWLPDGAIAHARRIILRPRAHDEGSAAMEALERAYRAGIPYYSAGLLLMREMLEILQADYPRAADILKAVSPVAARCDPRSTFTVLRFPEAGS